MTPRTDAFDAEHRFVDPDTACYAYSEFARTLERENQELRETLKNLLDCAEINYDGDAEKVIAAETLLQKTGGTNV